MNDCARIQNAKRHSLMKNKSTVHKSSPVASKNNFEKRKTLASKRRNGAGSKRNAPDDKSFKPEVDMKTKASPKTADDDDSDSSDNDEPDVLQMKIGDRMALKFGEEIYFGTIEKCSTRAKDRTKWRWTVTFDDETVYELESHDMVEGFLLYEKMKEAELNDPQYSSKLQKFKDSHLASKERVLSKIPDDVKAQFLQVGFADWLGCYQPVLFCGPYDVSPGQVRDDWMEAFKKHKASKGSPFPMIAYWFGVKTLENAFSVFRGEDWITYEEGVEKGLANVPAKITKKLAKNEMLTTDEKSILSTWTAMKDALDQPPEKRLPFPKLREDYECVMGLGGDRLLVEVKTEIRQRARTFG